MKLSHIAIGIIAVTLIAGFYLSQLTDQSRNSIRATTEEVVLSVVPQVSSSTVTISVVTLTEPAFVAVRSIEDNRLGQIIEISPYLLSGKHTNIKIELGEFYDGKSDLVAVVYQDDKSDMIFNDFDQPMRDSSGNVIARYVKTGESVSSTLFKSTGGDMPHLMGGMKMETVRYTNTGYEPPLLEVPVGTMVQFVNESDDEMWVASNEHPAHTDLPTFDQFGLSPKGSTYMYTFDKAGTWAYHDHINAEREGVIKAI